MVANRAAIASDAPGERLSSAPPPPLRETVICRATELR